MDARTNLNQNKLRYLWVIKQKVAVLFNGCHFLRLHRHSDFQENVLIINCLTLVAVNHDGFSSAAGLAELIRVQSLAKTAGAKGL